MRRTYLLSGGPHHSRSANARAASSAGPLAAPPPSERERRRRRARRCAVVRAARRRLNVNADGSWRATSAAKSTWPSTSSVAVSVTRVLMVFSPPSRSAISPSVSPGPASAISTVRSPGRCCETETPPSTTNTISFAVSPWRQRSSPSRTVRRRIARASSARYASSSPSRSGTVARNSTVSSSDIQVARLELEPVGRELGGQHRVLRHLEPRRCVGRERLRGDDRPAWWIGGRHLPAAVELGELAPDRVPEAHEREVRLEHLVLGRIPAVIEREPGGDDRAARADAQVDGRGGVDPVRRADLAQDPEGVGGGIRELARLREPVG